LAKGDKLTVSDDWDKLSDHLKGDLIIQVFRELSLVREHTRLLVLVAHGFIELLINTIIDNHIKNKKKITSDSRSFPHSAKLLILNELEIIDDEQYLTFDWFRKLRNKAAHQPIFHVTKNELCNLPNGKYNDPKELHSLCVTIISGLWNQHIEIFGPVFAPGTVGSNSEYVPNE
jgi:hypothetical protein